MRDTDHDLTLRGSRQFAEKLRADGLDDPKLKPDLNIGYGLAKSERFNAKIFDKEANKKEERARDEYIADHPELTRNQKNAAEVGGETTKGPKSDEIFDPVIPITPEKDETPPETVGETVGPQQYSGSDEPGPDYNQRVDLLAGESVTAGSEIVEPDGEDDPMATQPTPPPGYEETPQASADSSTDHGNAADRFSMHPRMIDFERTSGPDEPDGPTGEAPIKIPVTETSEKVQAQDPEVQRRLEYYETRINKAREKGDETEAKMFEEWTERLKYWVGVHNEKPASTSYQGFHPDIDFSAYGLFSAERRLKQDLAHVRVWKEEKALEYEPSAGEAQKGIRDLLKQLSHIAEDDPVLSDELAQRGKEDSFSFGDLKEIFRRVCQQEVAMAQVSADRYKQILNDIESGRASDPNYQKPAEGSSGSPEVSA